MRAGARSYINRLESIAEAETEDPRRQETLDIAERAGVLAFNDVQSTQLLAFTGIDLDNRERFVSVEGSRRLGQSWLLSLESRFFSGTEPGSALSTLRNDDYIEITLAKYF